MIVQFTMNLYCTCFRMSPINLWRTTCTCLSSVASFYVFPPRTLASSFSHAPTIFPAPRRSDVKSIFLACPSSDRKTIMPFFQAERKPLPSLKQLERTPPSPWSWLVASVFPCKLIMGRPLPPTYPRHPTQVLSEVLLSTYKSLNTRRPSEGSIFPLLSFTVTLPVNLGKRKLNEWEMDRQSCISIPPFVPSQKVPLGLAGSRPLVSRSSARLFSKPLHTTLYIYLSDSMLWGNRKTIHFLPRWVKIEHLLQCFTFWTSRDDTAWHSAAPSSVFSSIHS